MNKDEALAVARIINEHIEEWRTGAPDEAWLLADHRHEDLPEGSWSLACEGWLEYDWPWRITQDEQVQREVGPGVFLEPINGCTLGIYDDRG